MRNKTGSISVAVFVSLTVVLMIATLTSFVITNNELVSQVSDTKVINEFYIEENLAKFYLWSAGEIILDNAGDDLSQEDFKTSLISSFSVYKFEKESLKRFQQLIVDGHFKVEERPAGFLILIGGWNLGGVRDIEKDSIEFLVIKYNPKIEVYVGEDYLHLYQVYEDYNPIEVLPA